jgi:hypothetical protein
MKKIDSRKRFFLKSTIPLLLSLTTLQNLNLNFITSYKTRIIKFLKKDKKIWILNINDFK